MKGGNTIKSPILVYAVQFSGGYKSPLPLYIAVNKFIAYGKSTRQLIRGV